MLLATINSSIILIALPDIFRGIQLDSLAPANTNYLLWTILGFLIVIAVLVVTLGRLGDMYGRVRMYKLGFAVFTLFSILLAALRGSSASTRARRRHRPRRRTSGARRKPSCCGRPPPNARSCWAGRLSLSFKTTKT
jgi:uncharacterized membrane protein